MLRLIHYPALDKAFPKGAVRAAAHEDINLITLLPAATATGLQVKDSDGQWQDVTIPISSFSDFGTNPDLTDIKLVRYRSNGDISATATTDTFYVDQLVLVPELSSRVST